VKHRKTAETADKTKEIFSIRNEVKKHHTAENTKAKSERIKAYIT
jgi:hypothetical protein